MYGASTAHLADRLDVDGLLTVAMRLLPLKDAARLRWEVDGSPEDVAFLCQFLDGLKRWTATEEGGPSGDQRASTSNLGRPCDGREGPYPGRPSPSHSDPNKEKHYRWVLLLMSALHRMAHSYTGLSTYPGLGGGTVLNLFHGRVWGTVETRRRLTWHVLLWMLVSWGLRDTVDFIRAGGDAAPRGERNAEWYAKDGDCLQRPSLQYPPENGEWRTVRVGAWVEVNEEKHAGLDRRRRAAGRNGAGRYDGGGKEPR